MLLVWVARQLGSGNSFARLLCCPAQAERAGKRRPRSAKLTMPLDAMKLRVPLAVACLLLRLQPGLCRTESRFVLTAPRQGVGQPGQTVSPHPRHIGPVGEPAAQTG